jgi:hypothetical protein
MLVSNIQFGMGNAFSAYPKIPQTDPGQKILLQVAAQECGNMGTIGFIAPGVWNGLPVNQLSGLNLNTGDSLPLGYKVQSPLFVNQSPADRAAHKMMPIYVSIIESGSGRSITIQITVQQ